MDSEELSVNTNQRDVVNLTADLRAFCSGRGDGLASVFAPHSTVGLALMQCAEGCPEDLIELLDRLMPRDAPYHHAEKSPGHGADHLVSSLLSPSVVIPIDDGEPALGEYQHLVLVDLDCDTSVRRIRLSFIAG